MFKNTLLFAAGILTGCVAREHRDLPGFSEGRHITADSGMVVSAHPESSRIGIRVLMQGGNAVDAAVATELSLAVCYPEAGNIGGGGFMIIRNADGHTDMIDYREKAPMAASEEMYLDASGNVIPDLSTSTHLSSGVPGTVDGMIRAHAKYGKLPFRLLIKPAIDLARNGFPVTKEQADDLNHNRTQFMEKNLNRPAFVRDAAWKEGDTLKQPDLARTLESIRDRGRDGFYSGTTARLIVKEMKRGNGIITGKDLENYRAMFRDPLIAHYRNYRIITAAPPSGGGIVLLQVLGMLEPFDLRALGFHSPESIHLITEAERRAFADRAVYSGDPDFTPVAVKGLLDPDYLRMRMKDVDPGHASSSVMIREGKPAPAESEETTHYSVVDSRGNSVSATTTLNNGFGSSIVVDSAGFLLNDQMDDFSVKAGVPNMYGLVGGEANSIRPGKRMLSSMTPTIIEKEGRLFMVSGSPGGSTIPTTVLQVVTNVIDFDMTVSHAVDTGRFHHQWLPDNIVYESGSIDSAAIKKLSEMGYTMKPRSAIGRVNAIMVLPGERLAAGADKRGNNAACGY